MTTSLTRSETIAAEHHAADTDGDYVSNVDRIDALLESCGFPPESRENATDNYVAFELSLTDGHTYTEAELLEMFIGT